MSDRVPPLLLHRLAFLLFCLVQERAGRDAETTCSQGVNCFRPKCSCPTADIGLDPKKIPQMVYFGFDDALTVVVDKFYEKLFTRNRTNPNGCPIGMTLYISHDYTDYKLVKKYYGRGMEVAVHSVNHIGIVKGKVLFKEAKEQKENLVKLAGVRPEDITGWRSPFLKTAGEDQPDVLHKLGFTYDISLTFSRQKSKIRPIWPFTLDHGWPYHCQIPECPTKGHPGFWEIPVVSLMDKRNQYPCVYVDGCSQPPVTEAESFKFLWNNFKTNYETSRAPFGLNMHGAWFIYGDGLRVRGMERFLDEILKLDDVYVVTANQVIEWMKNPTMLSDIKSFQPWSCHETSSVRITVPSQSQISAREDTSSPTLPVGPNSNVATTLVSTRHPLSGITVRSQNQISVRADTSSPTLPVGPNSNVATTLVSTRHPLSGITVRSQNQISVKEDTSSPTLPVGPNSNVATTLVSIQHPQLAIATTGHFQPTTSTLNPHGPCRQGINCKLPKCFCKTTKIPGGLNLEETPQLVLLNIDGPVHTKSYSDYMEIFKSNRKNPNGCQIGGTMFLTGHSIPRLVKKLMDSGLEIALKGIGSRSYDDNFEHFFDDYNKQTRNLTSSSHIKQSDIKGWRTRMLKPLGDEQYAFLAEKKISYDSTLYDINDNTIKLPLWPYTLDFVEESCSSKCPLEKHPGLWEVPLSKLWNYKNKFACTYADGCPGLVLTAEDTFNFLWKNFLKRRSGNRAPFSINISHRWFHWYHAGNIKGLNMFIDRVLTLKTAYFVSISNAIKWIQNPTKISQMLSSQPWKC